MRDSDRRTTAFNARLQKMWWLFAFSWAALIFWLSSSPDAQGGVKFLYLLPYGDKLAHGVIFGVLGGLVYLASKRPWLALGLASLYGMSDELHQRFVPGRSFDPLDWVADTLGAILAIILVRYLTQRPWREANPLQ